MAEVSQRNTVSHRVIGSALAVASAAAIAGGVCAAPARATCSPGARPCIDKVFMADPTTLAFTWSGVGGAGSFFQVRYHATSDPGLFGPAGGPIPENQFDTSGNRWDIKGVRPGATYIVKVQGCTTPIEIIPTGSECSEWDEKSFTVPVKGRTLPETPIGGTPPYLDKQIDVSVDTGTDARVPTATAVGDVDVYSAKNEPDGAGHVVGILRKGSTVSLVGDCDAQSWCEVSGDAVPGQRGWVWGHLELPS